MLSYNSLLTSAEHAENLPILQFSVLVGGIDEQIQDGTNLVTGYEGFSNSVVAYRFDGCTFTSHSSHGEGEGSWAQ